MDRIAKIEAYAKARNEQMTQEANNKQAHIVELLNTVKSFAPRMKELMKVGVSMYENNIPFGPLCDEPGASESDDRIFFSNGWSHKVGFIQAYRIDGHRPKRTQHLPIGFGIIGGGCAGENLTFNSDGELEWLNKPFGEPAGVSGRPWTDCDTRHLERFVADFDKFETEFYAYADSL